MQSTKILLATCVLVLAVGLSFVPAKAEEAITSAINPSEGGGDTEILLSFLTNNASIGGVEYADIFWDETNIGLNVHGFLSGSGWWTYWITVPNEEPLSSIGNHTITVNSFVWNYGTVSFNFTFTITQWIPSPEYLALNATYYQLQTDYNTLDDNYQNLINLYNALSTNYTALLSQYSDLLGNYNNLLGSYSSLSSDYDAMNMTYHELAANYQSLNSTYSNLNTIYQNLSSIHNQLQNSYDGLAWSYNTLQSIHSTLTSNYAELQGNYTQLLSSYIALQTNNNNLSTDLTNHRNLTYTFVATTAVFFTTTIFFARRKLKT